MLMISHRRGAALLPEASRLIPEAARLAFLGGQVADSGGARLIPRGVAADSRGQWGPIQESVRGRFPRVASWGGSPVSPPGG